MQPRIRDDRSRFICGITAPRRLCAEFTFSLWFTNLPCLNAWVCVWVGGCLSVFGGLSSLLSHVFWTPVFYTFLFMWEHQPGSHRQQTAAPRRWSRKVFFSAISKYNIDRFSELTLIGQGYSPIIAIRSRTHCCDLATANSARHRTTRVCYYVYSSTSYIICTSRCRNGTSTPVLPLAVHCAE